MIFTDKNTVVRHGGNLYHEVMTRAKVKTSGAADIVQLVEMPNGGSDITLKKNIVHVDDVLARVLALQPITWNWRTEEDTAPLKYGFIAQEVEEVFPDLVQLKEWEDGTLRKFLSTNDLIPYLVAAIKEQQAELEDLRGQIENR